MVSESRIYNVFSESCLKIIQAANLIQLKAEKLLILYLSATSGRLSPLQIISKTGIRPPSFGLVEMEPLGSIGELRFQENLPHGLLLEDIPLSGCRKVALRLEDGSISHAARGGQPLLEPHSVRGGSSQTSTPPGSGRLQVSFAPLSLTFSSSSPRTLPRFWANCGRDSKSYL